MLKKKGETGKNEKNEEIEQNAFGLLFAGLVSADRKSTRLNSSH